MRIPLGVTLESRDGSVTKDAKVLNGVVEKRGDRTIVRKRPGLTDLGEVHSGNSQLLYAWNGVNTIHGDTLYRGTVATIVSGPTSAALSPTNAGLQFSAQETGSDAATQYLMIKNRTQAWTVSKSGVVTQITLPSGLGQATYSVTSITRSGGTATVTLDGTDAQIDVGDTVTIAGAGEGAYNGAQTVLTVTPYSYAPAADVTISSLTRVGTTATAVATAHGLTTATAYTISGADQSAYNGSKTITVVDANTFTYTVTLTAYTAIGGTWNSADKAASITLSGGDLTVAKSGVGNGFVRGTVSKAAGQWAWEITFTSGAGAIGIATSSFVLTDTGSSSAEAWVYRYSGSLQHNGSSTAVASYTNGDKIGIAFDGDANTVSFYKNGVFQGQFTGVTGTVYPLVGGTNVSNFVANFAGSFTYDYDQPPTTATGPTIVTDVTALVPTSFTYTVAGTPATPATGTITASTNAGMVPGIAYINGYFCVMDTNGVIYNSASDDPTSWSALDFVTAQAKNGAGKAIAVSGESYLVALKEWSTEPFFDAQNLTASPFSDVPNGVTQIGCASGDSVKELDGGLMWISQTKQLGRGVHRMVGVEAVKVSTPDVDRVLNTDDLSTVRTIAITEDGHSLYVLTLETSEITLVYDLTSDTWTQWSSIQASGVSVSITSLTLSNGVATAVCASAHNQNDGDVVLVAGADQLEYIGFKQINVVDDTTFTFRVGGAPASPATGTISALFLTETYFKFTHAANLSGINLLLHETDGHIYQMTPTAYRDGVALPTDIGAPINFFIRTTRLDGGANNIKKMAYAQVIGEKTDDTLMLRWSDDDCQTFGGYKIVDLNLEISRVRRCGPFRRRTLELKHIGNTSPRLEALELEIK